MTDAEIKTPPSLAIRAKPPTPKRLSRKVLLSAALITGAIIAFALISGLSGDRQSGQASDAEVQAAAGPPESIARASSSYDPLSLPTLDEHGGEGIEPPDDPFWAGGAPVDAPSDLPAASPQARVAETDPQTRARTSALLFADAETAGADENPAVLSARLEPPQSDYALQAGATIPAALITGLNSDLPGAVIAQVTAPVYDSITGQALLIPQGARLIGRYDNGVRYGDRRLFIVWTRLILPNGWSINLEEMQASDPAGASGLSDRTDYQLDRLGIAIGLSAIVSVIANGAEDNDDASAASAQNLGDAAAQQAAQTGARIVERELTVRPSLRVRPGAPMRVIVSRDIYLRPYRP